MYLLLIKQFFRSKTVFIAFATLMVLGALSIGTGKQFLNQKEVSIQKTIAQHDIHLENQLRLHKDDIGLMMYYFKFSFINPLQPLAGISIGQSDLNAHIQNVTILNLEGQKYDTDLVNPMRLQAGNLDFSFLIIYLFPLVIIALNFNLLSEEEEKGTWKMISIQGKSHFKFLLKKLSIRVLFVITTLGVLFIIASLVLKIPLAADFGNFILISYAYVLFWFTICFCVILLRKSSSMNAILLLTAWLVLVVFIPVVVNQYIVNTYPISEAYTMTIKQRDEYHKRWDTDKKETMNMFLKHYPQFAKYELQEKGFSWMWYYAMQQMGDDQSLGEKEAMYAKIKKRDALSKKIAQFFPPLQVQLSMNEIAKTSLMHHIDFLDATTKFHEDLRLDFYPKIFEAHKADTISWEKYKPSFYKIKPIYHLEALYSIMLMNIILIMISFFVKSKFLK